MAVKNLLVSYLIAEGMFFLVGGKGIVRIFAYKLDANLVHAYWLYHIDDQCAFSSGSLGNLNM